MQQRRPPCERPPLPHAGHAPDYTVPFLWTAGVLVFIALFAIWATWGMPAVLICAVLADRLIARR